MPLVTLERRNPLPAGLYWIDTLGANRDAFQDWRSVHAAVVKVRASEDFPDPKPGRTWHDAGCRSRSCFSGASHSSAMWRKV